MRTTSILAAAAIIASSSSLMAQSDPGLFDTVINVPEDQTSIFGGIGSNTQLNMFNGGEIGSFFSGGLADGTGVNTELNVFGGTVGEQFSANAGSTTNIFGGFIGDAFSASSGSNVNIYGGTFGYGVSPFSEFDMHTGSRVSIYGGYFGSRLRVHAGSTVDIHGGEFQFGGSSVVDLNEGLESFSTDLFTGVLADGTVFIFSGRSGDEISANTTTLTSVELPTIDTTPMVHSQGTMTKGLRVGQTLTVTGDGMIGDHFAAVGATLNIEGGLGGFRLETAFTEVNISGGTIGSFFFNHGATLTMTEGTIGARFRAYNGSVVNISGGNIGNLASIERSTANISGGSFGNFFGAGVLSTVNISGGDFGLSFSTQYGSTANITGGTFGDRTLVNWGSTMNIAGGSFGEGFQTQENTTVNIFGTSFFLDGFEMTELVEGEALIVDARNVELSGVLADGSFFSFDLLTNPPGPMADRFPRDMILTVTLVPAPGAVAVLALAGLAATRRRR